MRWTLHSRRGLTVAEPKVGASVNKRRSNASARSPIGWLIEPAPQQTKRVCVRRVQCKFRARKYTSTLAERSWRQVTRSGDHVLPLRPEVQKWPFFCVHSFTRANCTRLSVSLIYFVSCRCNYTQIYLWWVYILGVVVFKYIQRRSFYKYNTTLNGDSFSDVEWHINK